jgi:hypothetical protein
VLTKNALGFASLSIKINTGMRVIAFVVLLTLTSAGAASPERPPPSYWIFSWVMRSGTYRYIVVREAERAAFINGFRPSFPGNGDMSQLETQLLRLPKGVQIGWGNATCSGLTYPPKETMRSVRIFASAHQINLVVLPGQCDQH